MTIDVKESYATRIYTRHMTDLEKERYMPDDDVGHVVAVEIKGKSGTCVFFKEVFCIDGVTDFELAIAKRSAIAGFADLMGLKLPDPPAGVDLLDGDQP